MSSSCSSSSSFCALRLAAIVKFLVVYLEVQRFRVDEGSGVRISVMPFSSFDLWFFFLRSGNLEKFLRLTDKKERHLTCVTTL